MKALTWHGKHDVRVDTVDDPKIQDPTDVVVKVTTSGLCGSDLHLYEVFGPFLEDGDVLGHEPMGTVEEVGPEVTTLRPGDRVVVPFNVSCGTCFMCEQGLQSQCETTQVHEYGDGAALFGYTKLYGHVPGGQANTCVCPSGTRCPSPFLPVRRTNASFISPMCCRPLGRRWNTQPFHPVAASPYWVWVPSGT